MAKRKKTLRKAPAARRPAKPVAGLKAENAALKRELAEAREQQAAAAEVLRVIASFPNDLVPVFKTILKNAIRLCEAKFGTLFRYEDGMLRVVAQHGTPSALVEFQNRRGPFYPEPGTLHTRVLKTKRVAHTPDYAAEPSPGTAAKLGGARSTVIVPILKDDRLIGTIVIYRTEVRPFTDKQIELVQNFAAQAVIAIENTRLLNELRQRTDDLSESLDQQTATSEVLQVISSSPGELEPVFQAMLENAVRICGAKFGALSLREGNAFRNVAMHGVRATYFEERQRDPVIVPTSGHNLDRLLRTKAVVHIPDLAADKKAAQALYERAGARALLNVPLLKDNELIGSLMIYREEAGAFSDKQIALVTNFAAQAVIAIENTRLLNELRQRTDDLSESLEQQTATSEVLRVISSSPGELAPVFESMLDNACRICQADAGNLFLCEPGGLRAVAVHGETQYTETWQNRPLVTLQDGEDLPINRIARTKTLVHVTDMRTEPGYTARHPRVVALVDAAGARTLLNVPLLRDNELVGVFGIFRQEVRPFTHKQIELVQNFAAQAVIAIENTRLLNELRQRTGDLSESLEQQTATSEVLKVISSSPGELQPVFQAMLENATRICEAKFATLLRVENGAPRLMAQLGVPPALERYWRSEAHNPSPSNAITRVITTGRAVHVPDMRANEAYREQDPLAVAGVELGSIRTLLVVPMLKDGKTVGTIGIYRQEVQPFTDKQIELVQNFAAQAVIAIENTRLLSELRQRTGDLTESLEQQTATSEVLKVISSSPGDLNPVFQAMLANATRICEAQFGTLFRYDGALLHRVASTGTPPALVEFQERRGPFSPEDATNVMTKRVFREKAVIQLADLYVSDKESPPAKYGGARSIVGVPMLKDKDIVGIFVIYRQEVRPFTDKQVELLTNFAAQAVIAIENTRLLNELRQRTDDLTESLEQQTATSEVLQVISSSPGDLQPVFQTMLENATRICEAKFGTLLRFDGRHFHAAAQANTPPALAEYHRKRGPIQPTPDSPLDRLMRTKQISRTRDAAADPVIGTTARLGGARSMVAVPMLKDDELVGAITIYRQEVRPFTDKQIALVQNFAAQAVIAIENTRLLNELRQRTDDLTESLEQQTATSEVLKVISSSPGDLKPVFQAMLENATRICDARFGVLFKCESGVISPMAFRDVPPELVDFLSNRGPLVPAPGTTMARLLETRQIVHVDDVAREGGLSSPTARLGGARSYLGVPMTQDGEVVGAFNIYRQDVRPFTDKQIALVQNFAAQAVIAIENTRLLNELRESLQQQTATSDVLKVISRSTFDLEAVLNTLTELATRLLRAERSAIRLLKDGVYQHVASYGFAPDHVRRMQRDSVRPGEASIVNRVALEGKTIQLLDAQADPDPDVARRSRSGGTRTLLGVPLLREGAPIGVLLLQRTVVMPFTDKQIELAQTFADQAVIAIENVRLFDEIQDKSRQLAEASQHKSQFLANMSHELRTPLNAILGYTELILDGIYGAAPEKAQDVLRRVESNGRHLLGLINDVLDLSKIEAGELKLSLTDYSMKDVVYNVFSAVEPLANGKKLGFKVDTPPDLPAGHGDERRLTQVLLNLVGNAIKFTDTGEVAIKVAADNGSFNVAVHDTGPGISAADQAKLFQEFQQADSSITKAKGGTGLGLAISKRIIELHGGRIWVESAPGDGSTFTFTLPVMVKQQARPS